MNENFQLPITKLGINKEHCKALRQDGIVSISDLIAAFPHVGDLYESPLSSEDVDSILEKLGELDIDYYRETPATKGDIVSLLAAIRSVIREELESHCKTTDPIVVKVEDEAGTAVSTTVMESLMIPIGFYQIGVDVPAGRFKVTPVDGHFCYYRLGHEMVDGSVESRYALGPLEGDALANLYFIEGTYIEVSSGPIMIYPFKPIM